MFSTPFRIIPRTSGNTQRSFANAQRTLAAALSLLGASAGVLHAQRAADSTAKSVAKPTANASRPTPKHKTVKAKTALASKTKQDTTPPRVRGSLGPSSGDRHLADRDMGSDLDSLWPPKMPALLPGSIMPTKRVIAFYGNPLSKRMGILGEFETSEMLQKLDREVAEWNRLDPKHPVQPALHLIAVVAQADKGSDGKYRARMDSALIEKVYGWAKSRNAIMFLDVQVGLSTLQQELPALERFLRRPEVHLGIDPEFSMKDGSRPGKKIGTYDAADVNYASRYLQGLVDKYKLPPKILVIHRFTRKGVTNYTSIKLDPRVQIVMHMDGFGAGWKQFTKPRNDNPMTSREAILRLWPTPLYIQFQ